MLNGGNHGKLVQWHLKPFNGNQLLASIRKTLGKAGYPLEKRVS